VRTSASTPARPERASLYFRSTIGAPSNTHAKGDGDDGRRGADCPNVGFTVRAGRRTIHLASGNKQLSRVNNTGSNSLS